MDSERCILELLICFRCMILTLVRHSMPFQWCNFEFNALELVGIKIFIILTQSRVKVLDISLNHVGIEPIHYHMQTQL